MSTESPLQCEAVIGMLVPRPCGERAQGHCARCRRAVCAAHGEVLAAGLVCRHCAEGQPPRETVMDIPADLGFEPGDLEAFRTEKVDLPGNAWSDLT